VRAAICAPTASRHHQTHEVGAGLHVKTAFYREPRTAQLRVRGIQQLHAHDFGKSGDKISVFVENSGDDRQFIVIAPQRFLEVDASQVKVSQDGQPRLGFIFLEKTGFGTRLASRESPPARITLLNLEFRGFRGSMRVFGAK